MIRALSLSLLLVACGGAQAPVTESPRPPVPEVEAPPPASATTLVGRDETVTLETATFLAPEGWALTRGEGTARLTSPEDDVTALFVETEAPDVQSAVTRAWEAYAPTFPLVNPQVVSVPAADGWDEIVQIGYETRSSDSRAVIAGARRKGSRVVVLLIDGSLAGLSRRGAQVQVAADTFRLPGIERESLAGHAMRPFDAAIAAELEPFVTRALAVRYIPGAAIGIVQHGELVYSHGFGVRRAGDRGAVSPRTLFMIGSNTKPLTSLLMARLVDSGRMQWTTHVRDLLPEFGLGDEELAARVEMQHTVCACTGLPRRDLEFLCAGDDASPERWLAMLHEMQPTTRLGEVFQYSNLMVAAGGFAAARVIAPRGDLSGAYQTAMSREVFGPLGMRRTTLRIRDAARVEHAEPHGYTFSNHLIAMPLAMERGVESVGPAGAAWSNVEDLARYVEMELARGALPNGTRYLSEPALMERRNPRIRMSEDARYGLALVVTTKLGLPVVQHGGNTLGFTSQMQMFPEQDLGIIVLANAAAANTVLDAISARVLELLFEGRPHAEEKLAAFANIVAQTTEEQRSRTELVVPNEMRGELMGRYDNPLLGTLVLGEEDGDMTVTIGAMHSRLGTLRSGDATTLVLRDPPLAGVELIPPSEATGGHLRIDFPQSPYDFTRAE